jgi:predicted nucleic acid-binding protein
MLPSTKCSASTLVGACWIESAETVESAPPRRKSAGCARRGCPLYLADTSAWHRSGQAADRWEALLEADEIALCTPIRLELLLSARGPADYRALSSDLAQVRHLRLDDRCERAAARVQAALAERSQHRGPTPVDLLIAAVAEVNEAMLLHYDRHFDAIARVTGQPMEWLARRGSLD